MRLKFNKSATWKAGVFAFLMVIGFEEIYFYPNLDSFLSLQGYETFTLLSMFFLINYLMQAVHLKKDRLKIVPAGREETMKIVKELKRKNPETMKLLGK